MPLLFSYSLMKFKKSAYIRAFKVLTPGDKYKLFVITIVQTSLGILDLLGVAAVGVLGALVVSGFGSGNFGNKINFILNNMSKLADKFKLETIEYGREYILMLLDTISKIKDTLGTPIGHVMELLKTVIEQVGGKLSGLKGDEIQKLIFIANMLEVFKNITLSLKTLFLDQTEVTEEPIVARLHSMFGDVSSTVELDAEKIEHLVKKKSKLANLLQDAIELKESLYCSI